MFLQTTLCLSLSRHIYHSPIFWASNSYNVLRIEVRLQTVMFLSVSETNAPQSLTMIGTLVTSTQVWSVQKPKLCAGSFCFFSISNTRSRQLFHFGFSPPWRKGAAATWSIQSFIIPVFTKCNDQKLQQSGDVNHVQFFSSIKLHAWLGRRKVLFLHLPWIEVKVLSGCCYKWWHTKIRWNTITFSFDFLQSRG